MMAFSLDTGEWLRTIPTPTGGGPRELQRGMTGMTLGRDGSLYVSGYVRVLEFDPLGQYVSNWRPGTGRGVGRVRVGWAARHRVLHRGGDPAGAGRRGRGVWARHRGPPRVGHPRYADGDVGVSHSAPLPASCARKTRPTS